MGPCTSLALHYSIRIVPGRHSWRAGANIADADAGPSTSGRTGSRAESGSPRRDLPPLPPGGGGPPPGLAPAGPQQLRPGPQVCLVPLLMLLMMRQPHLRQPWRLGRCNLFILFIHYAGRWPRAGERAREGQVRARAGQAQQGPGRARRAPGLFLARSPLHCTVTSKAKEVCAFSSITCSEAQLLVRDAR